MNARDMGRSTGICGGASLYPQKKRACPINMDVPLSCYYVFALYTRLVPGGREEGKSSQMYRQTSTRLKSRSPPFSNRQKRT